MSTGDDPATVEQLTSRLAALEQERVRQRRDDRRALAALQRETGRLAAELATLRRLVALGDEAAGPREEGEARGPGYGAPNADTTQKPAPVDKQYGRGITQGDPSLQITSPTGGLFASSQQGPALYAESTGADAIVASSLSGHGMHAAGGGVRGGLGTCAQPCGIFAEGGSGDGLYATGNDVALHGVSTTGYGASLEGGKAPLYLVPAGTVGAPTQGIHLQGTLFSDTEVTLWLCVQSGSPGTWKRLVVV